MEEVSNSKILKEGFCRKGGKRFRPRGDTAKGLHHHEKTGEKGDSERGRGFSRKGATMKQAKSQKKIWSRSKTSMPGFGRSLQLKSKKKGEDQPARRSLLT